VVMMMVFFAHLNKTKTYQGPIFKPMSSYQKDILNNFD